MEEVYEIRLLVCKEQEDAIKAFFLHFDWEYVTVPTGKLIVNTNLVRCTSFTGKLYIYILLPAVEGNMVL
jgi:hypothetical protein